MYLSHHSTGSTCRVVQNQLRLKHILFPFSAAFPVDLFFKSLSPLQLIILSLDFVLDPGHR